jgi:hypothetical protein
VPDIGVTQIAHRQGVSPATFYRYIPAARTANTREMPIRRPRPQPTHDSPLPRINVVDRRPLDGPDSSTGDNLADVDHPQRVLHTVSHLQIRDAQSLLDPAMPHWYSRPKLRHSHWKFAPAIGAVAGAVRPQCRRTVGNWLQLLAPVTGNLGGYWHSALEIHELL